MIPKFRAWTLGAKKEIKGCLFPTSERAFIIDKFILHETIGKQKRWLEGLVEVDPATVGMFTGLHDKNNKEGWEGDKVRVKDGDGIAIGIIIWHKKEGQWFWQASEIDRFCITIFIGREIPLYEILDRRFRFQGEIIGNIHENPELLEEKE